MTEPLQQMRDEIDRIDDELVLLLARRAAQVEAIQRWKRAHGQPAADPGRERALIERLRRAGEAHGLDPDALERTLRTIIGVPER